LNKKLTLEIVSLSGQLILRQEIEKRIKSVEVDISSWQKGIYLVMLTGDQGLNTTEKLIVQ